MMYGTRTRKIKCTHAPGSSNVGGTRSHHVAHCIARSVTDTVGIRADRIQEEKHGFVGTCRPISGLETKNGRGESHLLNPPTRCLRA